MSSPFEASLCNCTLHSTPYFETNGTSNECNLVRTLVGSKRREQNNAILGKIKPPSQYLALAFKESRYKARALCRMRSGDIWEIMCQK